MKIGLVIYSQTGNTMSVAKEIQNKLTENGHEAVIEKIEAVGAESNARESFAFTSIPKPLGYDKLILAAPVQAFSLNGVMKKYLKEYFKTDAQTFGCLVTQHFKFSWMGGNNAVRAITSLCAAKGVKCEKSAIVHWSSAQRQREIDAAVQALSEV